MPARIPQEAGGGMSDIAAFHPNLRALSDTPSTETKEDQR